MSSKQTNEFDQRSEPTRETIDFEILSQQIKAWPSHELQMLWETYDEIATGSDFAQYLHYAKRQGLDPLSGEVVPSYRWNAIKRREVMTPLVTIGVLRKRRAEACDGLSQFVFTYAEGDRDKRVPVSASGMIFRKGCAQPFHATVWYDEYAPRDSQGAPVPMWYNKAHMLLSKVLEAQLTRLAFFDLCDFLIDEETQRGEILAPAATAPAEAAPEAFNVGEKAAPVAAEVVTPVAPQPPPEPPRFGVGPKDPTVAGLMETSPYEDIARQRAQWLANEHGVEFNVTSLSSGAVVEFFRPMTAKPGPEPLALTLRPEPVDPPIKTPIPNAVTISTAPTPTPAEPAPAAPSLVTPDPRDGANADAEFGNLLSVMRARIGGETTPADHLIRRYFQAFLGVEKLSKDRNTTIVPLRKLVDAGEGAVAKFKADPEALGKSLSGDPDRLLTKEFDALKWPETVRAMARRVMNARKPAMTPKEFINWIRAPILGETSRMVSISCLEPAALEVVFPLYLLVNSRAFEPVDWAIANRANLVETLNTIIGAAPKPLAEWDATFATHVLDTTKQLLAEQAEDPLSGGLPFGD
jgi:hypothetical protein